MTEKGSRPDRFEELLRRTASHGSPRMDRLVESVPAMLAESARRRTRDATPSARLSVAGRTWLPRLAAATALLAVAAFLWPGRTTDEVVAAVIDEESTIDNWIVTGSSSSEISDPVLDALVR